MSTNGETRGDQPVPAAPVLQYDSAPRGAAMEEEGAKSVRIILNWGADIGSMFTALLVLAIVLLFGLGTAFARQGMVITVASYTLVLACVWLGMRVIRSETRRWRREVVIAADPAGLKITLPGQGPWTMSGDRILHLWFVRYGISIGLPRHCMLVVKTDAGCHVAKLFLQSGVEDRRIQTALRRVLGHRDEPHRLPMLLLYKEIRGATLPEG